MGEWAMKTVTVKDNDELRKAFDDKAEEILCAFGGYVQGPPIDREQEYDFVFRRKK